MTFLLACLIDATLVLAIGLTLTMALRRRSAAVRHAVLTTAIVCAALMPAMELVIPQWPVVHWMNSSLVESSGLMFSSAEPALVTAAATPTITASRAVTWPLWLAGLWAAGTLAALAGLAIGLWRLKRLRDACTPVAGAWRVLTDSLAREYGLTRAVQLLQSDDPTLLVTYGLFKPGIILPAGARDWTSDRQRIVLLHELAHIRRHDAGIQVAAELVRVMQPFNPLVWMACRRLRQESEYACDDAVLSAGEAATDYASHLFDVATRLSGRQVVWASAAAIAHPSTLERRIVAMLQKQTDRRPLTPRGWSVAVALALGVSLPLAAVGMAPSPTIAPDNPVAAPLQPADSNVVALNAVPARPQATLSGTVQDETGGRMPGATVTVTNLQTQEPFVAVTSATGGFQFVNLSAGTYQLVAQLDGFRRVTASVDLTGGAPVNLSLTLSIGTLSEELTVRCGPAPSPIVQMFFPTLSAQEQPSVPIRIGGSIKPPFKTKNVDPVCPAGSVTGVVVLEGRIGEDGTMNSIRPLRVPAADLYDAAKNAVQQWEFTPTLLNGVPVEVVMAVTVNFTASR